MKTYNTAVIGCGMISKNHFKALKNVQNARCVLACDNKPQRARAAMELYGVPAMETDYRKVLENPDIDAVHICLPHYLHAAVAIEALEHGKHVLCEKPMALDPADAEAMIRARDKSGKQLGICLQNRYNESSRYMKELMDSGRMGRVIGGRGAVVWNRNPDYYTGSDWRGTLDKEGGSALENQAVHTFDLLQWLTVPVRTLEASCSTTSAPMFPENIGNLNSGKWASSSLAPVPTAMCTTPRWNWRSSAKTAASGWWATWSPPNSTARHRPGISPPARCWARITGAAATVS